MLLDLVKRYPLIGVENKELGEDELVQGPVTRSKSNVLDLPS